MKVFLYISDASFDGSLAFLRDLKARGQAASVFAPPLQKESNRKKISDLGFFLVDKESPYATLADEPGQSVLVTSFEKMLPANLDEGMHCSGFSIYGLEDITLPISNIPQRVNVANLLEKNLGRLLAIGYIAAPQDFWVFMNGVYKKWMDELYVSYSPVVHDLLFNFSVAFLDKAALIGVKEND
jgi:hypothetical protein